MRVLWLSHVVPYPPKGGGLQRSHNLLRQVAKRHEVSIVSLYQRKILPTSEALNEATREMERLCESVKIFPIKSDRSKLHWSWMAMRNYFSSLPYDVNWLDNEEMSSYLVKLSGHEKFDLVHLDTIGMIPYGFPFSRTPVVLNHHNVESHMMARRTEKEQAPLKRRYLRNESRKLRDLERRSCQKCAVNLVVSDLDEVRLKSIAGDVTTAVVPNGVDTDYFQSRKPLGAGGEGLIFAGPMDWYPNREAVIFILTEILPIIGKEKPDLSMTIVGRNPLKELIEAARHQNISVPGFVDDVRPYIDAAKIYLCPILDGGGTRLKILDALSMGKPVIATRLAVEGLGLREEEHYLRAENGQEFVNQIVRLDSDCELYNRLAISGRKLVVRRYSWDIIGGILEEAYREAIGTSLSSICH